ncbi:hypothetical protein [Vibrio sp. B1Z05]|uniref:hypothetical protein n=1 Tax=Vibrio sp. B1Z05 TaxID=2654980 RepID=UPI00128D76B2|nr:hypothetical protein [Vibrio sp. B1Z05]MPW37321.1 hypothetical protein [Vibrio sp. B1Z05]
MRTLWLLLLSTILFGCGGGDSSSSNSEANHTDTSEASLLDKPVSHSISSNNPKRQVEKTESVDKSKIVKRDKFTPSVHQKNKNAPKLNTHLNGFIFGQSKWGEATW